MYTTSVQGLLRQCLEATFDQKWGEVPRTHAPGATYKDKFYCQVNEKKKCFYLWRLRHELLQDKILQNIPMHTYIDGPEKNWGGLVPSSLQRASYVPLQGICLKASKSDV